MQGGFPLVKWNSNSNILVGAVRDVDGGANFLSTNGKVLGVQWDHAADGVCGRWVCPGMPCYLKASNAWVKDGELRALHEAQERLMEVFWHAWSTDYLRNLPPAVSQFRSRGVVRHGSVVMVREDNTPRWHWPLGVVEEVFPGKDGLTSSETNA
ncbi:hypothetical protein CAPTEDRAFT_204419 [Capitella teleta]|uniref:DUF5641 domain-containing protein n=1 Tax=Capitella teleta TaxID=283909 RepID=R7T450_CAPTE|nr:hypothetical protein CAPTEDRAFT_204419 [Capitella teleta]|eukprot:ELT87531.1 hypothetical protein CAPTEDRAFT_204419 [Capitella teleta]